jgi:hypothetical protein
MVKRETSHRNLQRNIVANKKLQENVARITRALDKALFFFLVLASHALPIRNDRRADTGNELWTPPWTVSKLAQFTKSCCHKWDGKY